MIRFIRPFGILAGMAICLFHTAGFAQESVNIHGRILDADSIKPVSLVSVALRGTQLGGETDRDGRFTINGVPTGTYILRASRVGYEELIRKDLLIDGHTDLDLNLFMTTKVYQLKEITVTPGSFSFMESSPSTRQTMSRDDIESVPQFGEDIFRAVNRLPGLSSGDYSAHFSIRGGRYDETLIMIDGLEIYEPYHLKDFNEGAISIIDVEAIEGVELMTGGFPAEYGNRLSGIFNIDSREPNPDGTKFSAGLSLMNARAMTEGTFSNDKGAWFLSARRGYLDLVFNIMNQGDLPSPVYYDIFSKIHYQFNPRHTLSFNVLHARDKYTYNAKGTTGFQDTIKTTEFANNKYGNSYAWVTLKSALGNRMAVTSMASAGLVNKTRDGFEQGVGLPDPVYELKNKRDFSSFGFKQDWMYELSNSIFLESGFDFRSVDADDIFTNIVGKNPDDPSADSLAYYPIESSSRLKKSGTTLGLYLANRFQIIDPVTLELGMRYDRGSYTKDSDFSPRVNALIKLAQRTNFRFGWGYYRQMQGIEDVTVLNGHDNYAPSELSKQWTGGFEQLFLNDARLRIEGYYKRGSNLRPKYRNWKGSIDVFPETDEDRILVYPDNTTSKGIEAYYTQNMGRVFSIRGSYGLSFVDEQTSRIDHLNDPTILEFNREHASPQDQRHALNLDCTFRPSRAWSINTSYSFHTGWPATREEMIDVTGEDGEEDFAIKPLKLYGHRLPNYHRMDARVTRRVSTSRGDLRFFFEVVNLTNHKNVLGYDYFKAQNINGDFFLHRDVETWFIVLPSIGLSWSGIF